MISTSSEESEYRSFVINDFVFLVLVFFNGIAFAFKIGVVSSEDDRDFFFCASFFITFNLFDNARFDPLNNFGDSFYLKKQNTKKKHPYYHDKKKNIENIAKKKKTYRDQT